MPTKNFRIHTYAWNLEKFRATKTENKQGGIGQHGEVLPSKAFCKMDMPYYTYAVRVTTTNHRLATKHVNVASVTEELNLYFI